MGQIYLFSPSQDLRARQRRKAIKSALAFEKIGNLAPNEQRSAQWDEFIFFSPSQDLRARQRKMIHKKKKNYIGGIYHE
ncbi:hypothetical protein BW721_09470 [Jeotgalibaca sp. PTS2502]|uniref:hypothetical protein n=1 Tax=Jeotgalibaca sp. PTS2502 TaxID=1903686 RepID=UPI000973A477|nr:hypothetical protein [Jeotgalibaca sp. PTS2502]APZ49842.1 hypothetical protein BW721_09470 [Jeotgalibaca sp. PTS2502]